MNYEFQAIKNYDTILALWCYSWGRIPFIQWQLCCCTLLCCVPLFSFTYCFNIMFDWHNVSVIWWCAPRLIDVHIIYVITNIQCCQFISEIIIILPHRMMMSMFHSISRDIKMSDCFRSVCSHWLAVPKLIRRTHVCRAKIDINK